MSSLNRRILQTVFVVGLSSLLPRAAMVARDMLIANHYGTGDQVDAFIVALSLPSLVMQIVAQAFAAALVPIFIRQRERGGSGGAVRLSAAACSAGLLILVAVAGLMVLGGPWIVALACPGFGPEKQLATLGYYDWFMPLLPIQGMAVIWSALLNACGRFALVTLAGAITPAAVLAALALPAAGTSLQPVVIATLVGAAVEAAVVALMMCREGLPLSRPERHPGLREVLDQVWPMLIGMILCNANLFIDQICASLQGSGGVAALTYSNKVPAFVMSLATLALGTAVLPHFSRHAAQGDWSGLRHALRIWGVLIVAATIPVTAALMSESEAVVRLLFERGHFSSADAGTVAWVQQCYLSQIPAYMVCFLCLKMLSSMSRNRIILYLSIANFVLNTAFDVILMRVWGLAGIALATSFVYLILLPVDVTCLVVALRRAQAT